MKKINKSFQDYWVNEAKTIKWLKIPKRALDIKNRKLQWYKDGKINIFDACIEKNLSQNKNKICINFYDKNRVLHQYSYMEISDYVKSLSFQLKKCSKEKKIKSLLIYGSASIETTISMLACSQLGIHFSVIFQDLSFEAVMLRAQLLKSNFIISRCIDNNFYNELFKTKNFNSKNVIFFHKDDKLKFKQVKKKIDLDFLRKNKKRYNVIKKIDPNKDFFTLFTSGSTGQPKGITHSAGNYLVYANHTCRKKFGLNKNSTILAASDAGWINGHTYALFGPLSIGSSTVIIEYPALLMDEQFLHEVILKCKVNVLYIPVTLIRMMKSLFVKNYKNKHLKTLGSMGEPLAKNVGKWFAGYFKLNNRAIINTYFQTETGGIITSPSYKDTIEKAPHGSVGNTTSKYINIDIDRKNFNEYKILNYWPGLMKKIINNKKIFDKYFDENNYFKLFDTGKKINNSYYVYGRIDDVLNIRGHRIGSGEMESVILSNKEIKEASVIDKKDNFTGTSIIVFVSLAKNVKNKIQIKYKIQKQITKFFGKFAIPENIFFIKELPKTKSGKILRRLLRNIYLQKDSKEYGDLSTILDSSLIKHIENEVSNKIQS